MDISIDGYDVGGWVVDGGQELTIERPAYEAKKFTFYRVKTAPKEAGIESGRSENGLVKCVFTPEVFLDVPVVIPGLPQPLKVNVAPSARVGDLKREVQSQLNATPDPDQILVYNEQFVLSNFTRLRSVLVILQYPSIILLSRICRSLKLKSFVLFDVAHLFTICFVKLRL